MAGVLRSKGGRTHNENVVEMKEISLVEIVPRIFPPIFL